MYEAKELLYTWVMADIRLNYQKDYNFILLNLSEGQQGFLDCFCFLFVCNKKILPLFFCLVCLLAVLSDCWAHPDQATHMQSSQKSSLIQSSSAWFKPGKISLHQGL